MHAPRVGIEGAQAIFHLRLRRRARPGLNADRLPVICAFGELAGRAYELSRLDVRGKHVPGALEVEAGVVVVGRPGERLEVERAGGMLQIERVDDVAPLKRADAVIVERHVIVDG